MAETFDVDVQEGEYVVTRRVSAPSEDVAQQRALQGKGLAIKRQLLSVGQPPPSGGEPETPAAADNSQLQAQIPDAFRGTITRPPSLMDQGVTLGVKYGPPALAGYLTGGASYPVQLGAQLAVTGGQQLLGIEPRQDLVPLAETFVADTLGRLGFGAGRALLRSVLPATPPGRLYQANQQRDKLRFRADRQQDLNDATQRQYQGEIDRALGAGMQEQAALDDSLARFEASTTQGLDVARTQRQQLQEGYGLVQSGLTKMGDDLRRYKNLQQLELGTARQEAATSTRAWLEQLPVPSDESLARLYGKVDTYNAQRLPASLVTSLDAARTEIAAKEARIGSVIPEAVNPRLQRLGRPGSGVQQLTAAQAAQEGQGLTAALSADPYKRPDGTWRVPLQDVPSQELELQDLLRQPDKRGRYGINLSDDELFGELDALLGKAESGSSRLKNSQSGLTSSEAAQRAHELGFIESPDTSSLLRALDDSVFGGRPVYSKYRSAAEVHYPGMTGADQTDPTALVPTFGTIREVLTRLGENIGDARSAVNAGRTGAREELRAWSSLYGTLERALDAAVASDELTPAARAVLQQANSAFKVRATVADLRGLLEARIRTQEGGAEVLNPALVLDALKRPANADLRQKLDDTGVLPGLETFLQDLQGKLAAPRDALKKARELDLLARQVREQVGPAEQQALGRLSAGETAMRERLQQARQGIAAEQAALGQQADARAGMLRSQADQAGRDGAETLRDLERQRASVPTPTFNNSLMFGYGPAALGAASTALTGNYGTGLGVVGAAESAALLARMLMTPKGQEVVGKVLEASGGVLTPAAVVMLSQAAKEPLFTHAERAGRTVRERLGVPALGGP